MVKFMLAVKLKGDDAIGDDPNIGDEGNILILTITSIILFILIYLIQEKTNYEDIIEDCIS
jgi:hypothetical protein